MGKKIKKAFKKIADPADIFGGSKKKKPGAAPVAPVDNTLQATPPTADAATTDAVKAEQERRRLLAQSQTILGDNASDTLG